MSQRPSITLRLSSTSIVSTYVLPWNQGSGAVKWSWFVHQNMKTMHTLSYEMLRHSYLDNATEYGAITDALPPLATAKYLRRPGNSTASGVADAPSFPAAAKNLQRPGKACLAFSNCTCLMKFASWNMRTLMDSDTRPERHTAPVGLELKRLDIDAAAL